MSSIKTATETQRKEVMQQQKPNVTSGKREQLSNDKIKQAMDREHGKLKGRSKNKSSRKSSQSNELGEHTRSGKDTMETSNLRQEEKFEVWPFQMYTLTEKKDRRRRLKSKQKPFSGNSHGNEGPCTTNSESLGKDTRTSP